MQYLTSTHDTNEIQENNGRKYVLTETKFKFRAALNMNSNMSVWKESHKIKMLIFVQLHLSVDP